MINFINCTQNKLSEAFTQYESESIEGLYFTSDTHRLYKSNTTACIGENLDKLSVGRSSTDNLKEPSYVILGQNNIVTSVEADTYDSSFFVAGVNNTVTAVAPSVIGNDNVVTGNYSVTLGHDGRNLGTGCVVLGGGYDSECNVFPTDLEKVTKETLESSFETQTFKAAFGDYSISAGQGTLTTGNYSVATGLQTLASGNSSFSANYHTRALHDYSAAFGQGTQTRNTNCFVVGQYNTIDPIPSLFVVGNGSIDSPHDAFTVGTDGNTYVNGTAYVSADLYAQRTLYVDHEAHIGNSSITNGYCKIGGIHIVPGVSELYDEVPYNLFQISADSVGPGSAEPIIYLGSGNREFVNARRNNLTHGDSITTTNSLCNSIVTGARNTVGNNSSGGDHVVCGADNNVSGWNSIVAGQHNTIAHDNCLVIGNNNTTSAPNQLILGKWNSFNASKLFMIGGGTDVTHPSNLFSVDNSGNVEAKGNIRLEGAINQLNLLQKKTFNLRGTINRNQLPVFVLDVVVPGLVTGIEGGSELDISWYLGATHQTGVSGVFTTFPAPILSDTYTYNIPITIYYIPFSSSQLDIL